MRKLTGKLVTLALTVAVFASSALADGVITGGRGVITGGKSVAEQIAEAVTALIGVITGG